MDNLEYEAAAAAAAADDFVESAAEAAAETASPLPAFDFLAFLRTPTGPGTVESYITHPLNAKESRGVAQMLRGFTGMFGALDLAIIDIALGGMAVVQEKKAVQNATETGE